MLADFSFKAADGTTVSVQRQQDRLLLNQGQTKTQPKALVVHVFQPDCPQCQAEMKALEALAKDYGGKGVTVLGVAHRGDAEAVKSVGQQLGITYPLLTGTGSEFAKKFAAGDALAITDGTGVVRFQQVGYSAGDKAGAGDEKVWRRDLDDLLAGKPMAQDTIERERLKVGDRIFAVRLDSLMTGKPMSLALEDGRLAFRDDAGRVLHPKVVVGMFSRY